MAIILKKSKKCKGTGKAKGAGCGNKSILMGYGLCPECYPAWLYGTEEGKDKIKRSAIRAKKQRKQKEKYIIKELKEEVKKKSEYESDLQNKINLLVRMIDSGKGCISCNHGWKDDWSRKKHAGHYYSRGARPSLRFNMLDIYLQCVQCNNFKSSNDKEYKKGLIAHYGNETMERIEALPLNYPELHLTIPELKEALKIAKKIEKDILSGIDYTREEINNLIGIYK